MFFFPFHTDAPLYHYPIGTILLVLVNIGMFFQFPAEANESLILTFAAINPLQWLTSNFMHEGIMHLAGNMLFLWSFGLIVEGKLGWYRFLPLYLGVGTVCGAILQICMLGSESGALGASTAIFGLIAIALVWAPRNELSCVLILLIRPMVVEIYVTTMAIIFLTLNIGFFILYGMLDEFQLSSEALHLLGFAVGAPIGVLLLKMNWVDCEGWDLFAVLAHTAGTVKSPDELRKETRETFAKTDEMLYAQVQLEQQSALELLRNHLAENRPRIAYAVFVKTAGKDGSHWELPEKDLLDLIKGLNAEKMFPELVPLLVQAIGRASDHEAPLRLHLAKIMVQVENRPKQALAVLEKLPDTLTDAQRQQRHKIAALAHHAIEEGEVEFEIKDW